MLAKELRAYLENIVDDLPIYIQLDGTSIPLTEECMDIVTFEGDTFQGPTVLIIHTNEYSKGEDEN